MIETMQIPQSEITRFVDLQSAKRFMGNSEDHIRQWKHNRQFLPRKLRRRL